MSAVRGLRTGVTFAVTNLLFRDLIFSIPELISFLSQGTTLEPGTLILTGTPAGVGFTRDPKVVLRDGDDLRIHISDIGTLCNTVYYEIW